jgi:hypothetical protein
LALVFGFVAVVAQLIYWSNATDRDHAYNNTDAGKIDLAGRNEVMKLRAQTELARAQTELAQATGVPAPTASLPNQERGIRMRSIDDLVDGSEVILPANAKITLRGPMTVTFVNSAGLIKGFSGDFRLHVENSENWAWTPGYDSKSPPLTVNDFLGHLRKRTFPNRVTLTIKQGVVELNT